MNTTPVSLLERLKQPEQPAAWVRFVDLYTPLLYYWARRLGIPSPDAADLVQEVFLVLVRKLPEFSYDHQRSFRSWLRTVTVNKWRELHRRLPQPQPAGDPRAWADVPAPDQADLFAEEEYRQQLATRALELVQDEFQPTTWKAFWESVVVGRPAAEVGRELGITANAVYIARSRVLTYLRRELDGLLE